MNHQKEMRPALTTGLFLATCNTLCGRKIDSVIFHVFRRAGQICYRFTGNTSSSDRHYCRLLNLQVFLIFRWVVGSAYRVGNEGGAVSASAVSSQGISSFPEDIVQLARRAKMNTEVRRNIFCTVATSDDEDSAFEKLLRLSLKGQQEREIIYVLIVMLLKEKTFNAFYPMLIARFCEFDKRFALTTQYALWDRIREVDSLKLRARTRLADLIHHLIANEVLPITILKVGVGGITFTLEGFLSKGPCTLLRQRGVAMMKHRAATT
ncbi:unnamed protein product, partial [Heligmosomoides polygyrus]|uniref:MI domain-containing protein n=1 Tax=Heligmosomoides polygyrus TaxID=6339 RepID=A0A183FAQ0_HELPZ